MLQERWIRQNGNVSGFIQDLFGAGVTVVT